MKYLIYESVEDAQERNHQARLQRNGWHPENVDDTIYNWHMITFPYYDQNDNLLYDGPEAVLCVDEGQEWMLDATELARAYDTKAQVLGALQS